MRNPKRYGGGAVGVKRRAGRRSAPRESKAPDHPWPRAGLTGTPRVRSVPPVTTQTVLRIEPPAEIVAAARAWLEPVRQALGAEFLSAYLTGSVLIQGFDPEKSRVNLLVVSRGLDAPTLERVRAALPEPKKSPRFDPLFMTRPQIHNSLDTFPIEWTEIGERHLLLEGEDVVQNLAILERDLRLQCEHELRAKHIRLRQAYLASAHDANPLADVLRDSATSFTTLFRTLLRLSGETPPASPAKVIERVADVFQLDAEGLLGAHLVRHGSRRPKGDEVLVTYRKFLHEVSRLVVAIDQLRTT